ncbi:MAG: glycosyltransferase family 2 protein [Ilumatobacteraceae bacterium]
MILYYRHLTGRRAMPKFLTLADMLRTGDDIGRFRFQYRLGKASMGMHGSYIVIRTRRRATHRSRCRRRRLATEDAWFAMAAQASGVEFTWVNGYVVEQAPERAVDFVKQRRRWWNGLFGWRCSLRPRPGRTTLFGFLVLWGAAMVGSIYTVLKLPRPGDPPGGELARQHLLRLGTSPCTSRAAAQPGRLAAGHGCLAERRRRVRYYGALVVLMPVFGMLEAAAVMYGMARPERGFTVITKSNVPSVPSVPNHTGLVGGSLALA